MKFWQSTAFSDAGQLVTLAKAAEEAGMEGMALSDHIFFPQDLKSAYPYSPDGSPIWTPATPWPDVWVTVGAMAAVTTRLRFGTNIYIAPARDVFTVAKAVGTAAVLSDDRVALGVAAGWMKEEFVATGQEYHNRGKRLDEMFAALRALWSPGWTEHHGEHYDFGPLMMAPTPKQMIPIWCGGDSEPALRRTARYADGFIGNPYTYDQAVKVVGRIRELLKEEGREHEPFEMITVSLDPPSLDSYKRLEDLGVDGVVTVPWLTAWDAFSESVAGVQGTTPLETKLEVLKRFSDEFISKLS